jgi:hypothetical protein
MAWGRATGRQRNTERRARKRAASRTTPQGIAEVLLWESAFMDKENTQEVRHVTGYDEAAFAALRASCASCACALCGVIIFGRATGRNASTAPGRLVSEGAAAARMFSTRGFVHNGRVLPLIKHLVDDDGSFFSCSDCDGELQRLESASENEPAPLPARFRLDFGLRSDLPEPTVVEKAAIAINRMYGKVIKIKHNMGEFTPPQLCGHLISFRHSGPTAVASSLPNVDFDRLIVVHFIGGKKKWETMMPMLAGTRDHVLALRPEVVFAWLVRLKQTHPRYQTMPIDVSDVNLTLTLT